MALLVFRSLERLHNPYGQTNSVELVGTSVFSVSRHDQSQQNLETSKGSSVVPLTSNVMTLETLFELLASGRRWNITVRAPMMFDSWDDQRVARD